jgi:uncharacterized protein YcfL
MFRILAAVLGGCIAGLSLVVVSAGCGANTYTTRTPTSNVELNRIARDPGLASDVQVVAANLTKASGRNAAQVVIRNLGGATRDIEVKFIWRDVDSIDRAPNLNTWRPYTLGSGEETSISSVGGDWASDFTVMIRARR